MDADTPLFPIRLYIYRPDGTHGPPFILYSEEMLRLCTAAVTAAIKRGVEVVIEDPAGMCVFHAHSGKIIFPIPSPDEKQK